MYRRDIINIADIDLNIIKGDVKLKHLPRVDEIIYFDPKESKNYLVTRVLHHIDKKRNIIWIIVSPLQ